MLEQLSPDDDLLKLVGLAKLLWLSRWTLFTVTPGGTALTVTPARKDSCILRSYQHLMGLAPGASAVTAW